MKKILFVYDHKKPEQLKGDGLWSALDLLEKDFEITRLNINNREDVVVFEPYNFVLGWGAFDSKVDKSMMSVAIPKGLCLAAQFPVNETAKNYDMIFYETESIRHWLETQGLTKLTHAFGINTDIFKPYEIKKLPHGFEDHMFLPKIWDYISVGSFSNWHRQEKLLGKKGYNLAIGEIMQGNLQESLSLVVSLAMSGWCISNEVSQERLAELYNMSEKCILTSDFGQERACLEARACNLVVEVPDDNPKLQELLTTPIWDHSYYADQLKKGIESCF